MNYGEFESSKGEGFYRIFYIISAVRITTTTSADGVHACNIMYKKQLLSADWTVWVSSPGEGAIVRTHAEGPQYPLSRQDHA